MALKTSGSKLQSHFTDSRVIMSHLYQLSACRPRYRRRPCECRNNRKLLRSQKLGRETVSNNRPFRSQNTREDARRRSLSFLRSSLGFLELVFRTDMHISVVYTAGMWNALLLSQQRGRHSKCAAAVAFYTRALTHSASAS